MPAFAIQLVYMGTTFIFPATLLANSLKFTVKYVLSVSESSNSIQNYFLEAVTLWSRKGVLGLEQDRIHWAKTVRKQPVLLLTVGVGTSDPPGGHCSSPVLDL